MANETLEDTIFRLKMALLLAAQKCDRWAEESLTGGWSTHQVDANRKLADDMRREATK